MWCVASRPPRSSVVGFLEPDHPGSALGGLSAHDEHTSASSGESSPLCRPQAEQAAPPRRRRFAEAVERYEQSRDQFPRAEPFPASTISAPPRSVCTVLTTTGQGYGSRVAF